MEIQRELETPLSLSNSGTLELLFFGTGSAFAATHRQTNFMLKKGSAHVVVDFGTTGPIALNEYGVQSTEIEVVLPTHSHADHIGGVECLALMNRYVGVRFMNRPKLKLIIPESYETVLWENTLRGGLEWNETDHEGKALTFHDYFDAVHPTRKKKAKRETYTIDIPCGPRRKKLRLEIFRTNHIPEQAESWESAFPSYGLFVDDKLFISGDSKFDPDLINTYAARSEVMFHDVQFFTGGVHASLAELATLPDEVKQKMYLTHYADNWEEQDIDGFAGWAEEGVLYRFP